MNDKIEIIYEEVQKMRSALGMTEEVDETGKCRNTIYDITNKVIELANDTSRNGLSTIFVLSTESSPSIPTADTINLSTGLVENLDEDWTQTGSSTSDDFVWMSFAVFGADGKRLTSWSYPTNIKGSQGPQGLQGESGEKGEQGIKGESGEDGAVYRTAMAYTMTNTTETPIRPYGGFWNRDTNEIVEINSDDECVWVSNSDQVEKKTYRWISEATFDQNGYIIGEWSIPFRLTGEDGKDGKDGESIEFVYRLLPNMDVYDSLREYLPEHPLYSSSESDKVPTPTDDFTTTVWTDSPQGISENWPIEVVCSRTKDSVTNKWSAWTNCVIWSKWGEDGTDGDGVEYIYVITPKRDNAGNDITSDWVLRNKMPDLDLLMSHPRYQEDEFCINDEYTVEGYNLNGYDWTDEPSDVGPNEPMEWVCVRKKSAPDGNGIWGRFSDPKLWATYSKDGAAYLTSYVFTRSADTPYPPIGGSYSDPNPENNDVWCDSVPDGTEPVWMSTRTFCSDPDNDFDDDWTSPKILSDSPNFQVEYSRGNELGIVNKESLGSLNDFIGAEDVELAWRTNQLETYNIKWGDDDTISDPIWMITSTYTGGRWSDWTLTRIKGEKGDSGENGSSVAIEGQFDTKQQLLDAWQKYVETGSVEDFYFESKDGIINQGDGWFVKEDGFLYVYSGGWSSEESDSEFENYWMGVEIKGKPGDNAYLYVAYADEDPIKNPDTTIYGKNEGPKKYIGFWPTTYVVDENGSDIKDPLNYTWQRWQGEDGWGQEQIFLLTDGRYDPNGNHPPLPLKEVDDQKADYLPSTANIPGAATTTWKDTPQTVTEEYPYCWVVTRKASEKEFGPWKGRDDEHAALYSRYSYDGQAAINIHLTNDLAVIPTDETGKVDVDFLSEEVYTVVQAFCGDEPVESEQISVSVPGGLCTVDGTKVTLNLKAITADTTAIPIEVRINGKENPYNISWNILVTDIAYEIKPSTYTLRRITNGENAGKIDQSSLDVYLYKWNGKKWVQADVPLFAEIKKIDGTKYETLSRENNIYHESNSNYRSVNLTGYNDVSYVELYIVQKDNLGKYDPNGSRISWERISAVADGLNGGQLDVSLYPDITAVPLEGEYVDPDFINLYNEDNPLKTTITVRKEGVIMPAAQSVISFTDNAYYDIFDVVTDKYGDQTGEVVVKDISKLYGFKELPIKVVPNWDRSDNRIVTWRFNNTINAYLFELSESALERNPYTGLMFDSEVDMVVRKWGGDKFVTTVSSPVFAKVTAENGKVVEGEVVDEHFNFDFAEFKNCTSIMFYVTDDKTKDGMVLHSETISVTADGKQGEVGPEGPQGEIGPQGPQGEQGIQGENGTSPFTAALSPDWVQIPTENGKIDKGCIGQTFDVSVAVYHGDREMMVSEYSVQVDPASGWTWNDETKKLSFTVTESNYSIMDKQVEISVYVKEHDVTIQKMLYVEHAETAYRVYLNNDPIRLDDNRWPIDNVSGRIEKWNNQDDVFEACAISLKVKERTGLYEVSGSSDSSGQFDIELPTDKTPNGLVLYGYNSSNEVVISEPIAVVQSTMTVDDKAAILSALSETSANNFAEAKKDLDEELKKAQEELDEALRLVSDQTAVAKENAEAAAKAAETAEANANKSATEAENANKRLNEWAADKVISPTEKKGIVDEFVFIGADNDDIIDQMVRYWGDTYQNNSEFIAYNSAYIAYKNDLDSIIKSELETVPFPNNFETHQEEFYNGRTAVLSAIAAKAKSVADDAANKATTAQGTAELAQQAANAAAGAAEEAKGKANSAESVANAATNKLTDWASDKTISPIEKLGLSEELVFIVADKGDIDNQIEVYDFAEEKNLYSTYVTAYEAYKTILEEILNSAESEVHLTDDQKSRFDSAPSTFYNARTPLLKAIAEAAKKFATDAQETANAAKNGIGGLQAAQEQLAKEFADYARLNNVDNAIKTIEERYFDESGKILPGALDENHIYDLSIAALGQDAPDNIIPEGGVKADSYFGRYFAGSVGVFGELIASQITADKITGPVKEVVDSIDNFTGLDIWSNSTYESSAWGLNKDGSGKIANGQISWNADGSDVELGENVKIGWGSVTGTDAMTNSIDAAQTAAGEAKSAADAAKTTAATAQSTANDASQNATSALTAAQNAQTAINNLPKIYSKEEIEAYATTITKDTVTAPFINALDITAKNITAEALAAHEAYIENLAANNVSAKSINTTPGETKAGTIKIEGNKMSVYKANEKSEVLIVSGDSGKETFIKEETFGSLDTSNASFNNEVGSVFPPMINGGSSVTIPNCVFKATSSIDPTINITCTSAVSPHSSNTFTLSGTIKLYVVISSVKLNSTDQLIAMQSALEDNCMFFDYEKRITLSNSGTTFQSVTGTFSITDSDFIRSAVSNVQYWNGSGLSSIEQAPAGTYYLYTNIGSTAYASGDYIEQNKITRAEATCSNISVTVTPTYKRFKITSDGIRYVDAYNKYFIAKDGGTFIMRNGKNGLGVDDTGPFFVLNGKRYSLTANSGTEGSSITWDNYE